MSKKHLSLSDQIRAAILAAPVSRYQISKVTGIPEGNLSRFVAGKSGLSLASVDRVGEYLGLQIVVAPKRKAKGE